VADEFILEATGGAQKRAALQLGNIPDGYLAKRVGNALVGVLPSSVALATKSGIVAAGSFVADPVLRKATVTFAVAFADNNYSVTVTGEDARGWTIESKTAAGFKISSGSAAALAGNTFWIAVKNGETS